MSFSKGLKKTKDTLFATKGKDVTKITPSFLKDPMALQTESQGMSAMKGGGGWQ